MFHVFEGKITPVTPYELQPDDPLRVSIATPGGPTPYKTTSKLERDDALGAACSLYTESLEVATEQALNWLAAKRAALETELDVLNQKAVVLLPSCRESLDPFALLQHPAAAAAYAAVGFSRCPVCQSDAIEGGSLDIDGNIATQEVGCNDCSASWQDEYRLKGLTSLTLDEAE